MINFSNFFKEAIGYKDDADIQEATDFLRQHEKELKFFVEEFLPRMEKLQFFKFAFKDMSKEEKLQAFKNLKGLNFDYLNNFRYDLNFKQELAEIKVLQAFKVEGDIANFDINTSEDILRAFSLCDNIKCRTILTDIQLHIIFDYKGKTRTEHYSILYSDGKLIGLSQYTSGNNDTLRNNLFKYLIKLMQDEGFDCEIRTPIITHNVIKIKSFYKNV